MYVLPVIAKTKINSKPVSDLRCLTAMEALREIKHIQGRKLTLTVPPGLNNRDVEVIVLPVETPLHFPRSTPASQRGSLHEFSNPEKMTEEKAVWAASAGEKHASH